MKKKPKKIYNNMRDIEVVTKEIVDMLRSRAQILLDDSYACTFQSMKQYRQAVYKFLFPEESEKPNDCSVYFHCSCGEIIREKGQVKELKCSKCSTRIVRVYDADDESYHYYSRS